jgi:hypothetical protein
MVKFFQIIRGELYYLEVITAVKQSFTNTESNYDHRAVLRTTFETTKQNQTGS